MTLITPTQTTSMTAAQQVTVTHAAQKELERQQRVEIMDTIQSMHADIQECMANMKDEPTPSPWADVTRIFATFWRCIVSVFTRSH